MNTKTTTSTGGKLGVMALSALIISSMIGGGIFSLPQNMSATASAGAVLLAWLVTGFGMFFIANTFRILSESRPDLTAGIYMYAREGFGPFAGFTIGWGYWICQIFGNVGYAVITMDALNYFFPGVFTGGNNIPSIIGGSIIIWSFNYLVLQGVKQASFINVIGTIAKLVPLGIFILIMAIVFHADKFDFNFWGHMTGKGMMSLGSLGTQLKSTMLVTLWAFIGIEGAVVLSGRAKSQSAVGSATFIGFVGCLVIYALISLLPYGFMSQVEVANVPNPSTAGVLEMVVGKWGAWLMNIGLLIAVLTSWLAWTLIAIEIPYAAAKNGTFPKFFARQNSKETPSHALWVTSIIMQLVLLLVYFSNNAWNTMLSITGVMVLPAYFTSTLFLWKYSEDNLNGTKSVAARSTCILSGFLGSIYALWLIYAAGLNYLMMAVIVLALGIPVYVWARKENTRNQPIFNFGDLILMLLLLLVALAAIYGFSRGLIHL